MIIRRIAFFSLIAFALASTAQTPKPDPSRNATSTPQLNLKSSAKLSLTGTFTTKLQCDDSGDLYALVRLDPSKDVASKSYAVTRIKPDGTIGGSLSMTEGYPDLRVGAFFVTGDGKVFGAAHSNAGLDDYVVSFSGSSSSGKPVRLQAEYFLPYQIVVFTTGEWLLSGIKGTRYMTPYTAIFNSEGKVIKSIYETEDAELANKAAKMDTHVAFDDVQHGNSFVTAGDGALGSDGNAYLLRAGDPALIYVISNKGEVVRKLTIASPRPGLVARNLKLSSGKLAIVFLEKGKNRGAITVADYEGRILSVNDSDNPQMLPGLMGCYRNGDLTFLAFDSEDKPEINRVELK